MEKFKNKLLLVLSIFLVVGLTACGTNSDNAEKDVDGVDNEETNVFTVWAWDPNFNIKALEIAEEMYKEENPNFELEIIENTHEDIVQKMNVTLGSGTTEGLPNIILMEDTRAQVSLKSYPDAFFEISDYFDSNDFANYKLGATQVDEKDYGLPFDSGVTALYVRTDYLDEAGYSVDDLEDITWDEYIEIGKDVKKSTGKPMISLEADDAGLIKAAMHSANTWYFEEDGVTPYIEDNDAFREATMIFKELLDSGVATTHSDFADRISLFNDGEVASVFDGNWIGSSIKAEESQSGKWAIVPTPRLENQPESVNASNLGGSSWYVMDVDGKEQAAEFLGETFGSNEELYQNLVEDVGALGTYLPASEGAAYDVEDEFFNNQKIYEKLSNWMEIVPQINYGDQMGAIDEITTNERQNYLNGEDLDETLKSAQEQAEGLN